MSVFAPGRRVPALAGRFPAKQPVLADLVPTARIPAIGPLAPAQVRDLVLMVAASLLLAAVAQISFTVPFSADRTGELVPITGQTFGVLLIGVTLGSRRAAGSILLYLSWGWAGAPFFASGASGFGVLYTGSTAGYLWGFVIAAVAVGWLAERGLDRGNALVVAMLIGNALVYAVGLPVLALWLHNNGISLNVLDAGLWPFLPGDFAKILAASAATVGAWAALGRFGPAHLRR